MQKASKLLVYPCGSNEHQNHISPGRQGLGGVGTGDTPYPWVLQSPRPELQGRRSLSDPGGPRVGPSPATPHPAEAKGCSQVHSGWPPSDLAQREAGGQARSQESVTLKDTNSPLLLLLKRKEILLVQTHSLQTAADAPATAAVPVQAPLGLSGPIF